jgi:F-type H+-transporting ATPase subunit beta
MNDKINTFPVGTNILGRVFNVSGDPIDKKGPLIDKQRVPIYNPASGVALFGANEVKVPINQTLETGIKVIDLLAPLPRGGVVGIFGNVGTGKLVVMEELMHRIISKHSGYIICLSLGESAYEVSELMDLIREGELEEKVVMIFEQMNASSEVQTGMILAGLTIAEHTQQQGHEVLLVLDKQMTTVVAQERIQMSGMCRMLEEKKITAILLGTEEHSSQFQIGDMLGDLDSQIMLTRKMADQSLWPAIDRLLSNSRLLTNEVVGFEHVQLALQIREILQKYVDLETLEHQELLDVDTQVIRRAQRIQKFFTQPFFVAEAYTDIPGEYVKVEETVRGFKGLVAGQYDSLTDQAFYFVGGINEAVAKGKRISELG